MNKQLDSTKAVRLDKPASAARVESLLEDLFGATPFDLTVDELFTRRTPEGRHRQMKLTALYVWDEVSCTMRLTSAGTDATECWNNLCGLIEAAGKK